MSFFLNGFPSHGERKKCIALWWAVHVNSPSLVTLQLLNLEGDYEVLLERIYPGRYSCLLIINALQPYQPCFVKPPVCSVFFQVQDAQAAMRLYTLEKKQWEAAIKNKSKNKL